MKPFTLLTSVLILIASQHVYSVDKTANTGSDGTGTKTYLVVFGSPKNPEHVKSYQAGVGPILKEYGAMLPPAMQLRVNQLIAGSSEPKFMTIVEFPDAANIQNAFNDPRYLAIVDERELGFKDLHILIVSQ